MAAGLGFKTFTTGEVLTAGDVNGYLMQGVLVFATAAARNSAITSPQEGQFAFTKDTNGLWYYDGAAWVASGATGDIEGVTAGVGITGGGTSGTVTVTNDMATTITTAGDLIKGTGSGTYNRLGIGSTGQVLTVASGAPSWATPAGGGGFTLLQTLSCTTASTTSSSISASYKYIYVELVGGQLNGEQILLRMNSDSSGLYGQASIGTANLAMTNTSITLSSQNVGNVATNLMALTFPNYSNTTTHKIVQAYFFLRREV